MTAYFTKLRGIWEELEGFQPIPSCLCNIPCTCTLIPIMKSYRETNYVIRFLKGLNEQYSGVRSQVMLMPLPSINKVYSMLTQQERQMNPHLDESRVLANFSDANSQGRGNGGRGNPGRGNYGGGRNQGGRGKRKICTYCNKVGHMVDTCYKKHGYPPHYQKSASNFVTDQEIEDENSDGSV